MIYISHRGNTEGINLDKENTPSYIDKAITTGFDVEVDVWYINDQFWLGHDKPTIQIPISFLNNDRLWVHCKNIDALYKLYNYTHCFFIDVDKVSLTSKNYLWTYTGEKLTPKSICVLPEQVKYTSKELEISAGICSDLIANYII